MSVFLIIVTLALWALFTVLFMKDRSRYRNCYLLFIAIVFTIFTGALLAGEYMLQTLAFLFLATCLVILAVPCLLVHNGFVMYRREGHSLANLLSFALGLIVGFGEIATFVIVFGPIFAGSDSRLMMLFSRISLANIIISTSVIYLSMTFVIFMIYSLFLMIIPRKNDFDYVIIHGAGLLDGNRVSKLLADRLDKAIDVYRKDPTPPVLIPSGGKGSDESISEAEAMAQYLLDKGIPEDKIIREDQSATTFENLVNSKAIIDAQEGSKYTALVTSNYHVYRALRYCRKVGLDCTGIGSRVALYYWPSALIREFIAVHAERKHFIYLLIGWVICVLPFVLLFTAK